MKNLIKFNYLGVMFELPIHTLRTHSYSGIKLSNPIITIGRKEVPLMFKQWMKVKYPHMLVWGKSSSFAGGSSSDLYVCYPNGEPIEYDDIKYKEIHSFCNSLQGGHWDGMNDIYEYGENGLTDNGTELEFNAKWVSFNPKAPYGTWPEGLGTIKAMMRGDYTFGILTLEQSIQRLRGYSYTEATIERVVKELGYWGYNIN